MMSRRQLLGACALLAVFAGAWAAAAAAASASYATVQAAVAARPELSMLEDNVASIPLAAQLADPSFVGTVFAPINAALTPILEAVGSLDALFGDPAQVNTVFSASVVPGRALAIADLTNGMTLQTLDGGSVAVRVVNGANGPTVFINQAPVVLGNVRAGQAVVHEVAGVVVPAQYQDMLDTLSPASGTPAPTQVLALAAPVLGGTAAAGTTTGTTPTGATNAVATEYAAGDATTTTNADGIVEESGTAAATTTSSSSSSSGARLVAGFVVALAVPALLAALL